jgi:predicted transcriptional regulator
MISEFGYKNTGRSRSFLATEAMKEYIGLNEWQSVGVAATLLIPG